MPWEKTVIGGFSQGGAVALALALGTGRPRAAGVLAMSCFLPMVRGWRLDIHAKRGMPAYVCHGAFDNIIPVGFGRRVNDVLSEEGPLERHLPRDARPALDRPGAAPRDAPVGLGRDRRARPDRQTGRSSLV